jgi:hypothetical protein
MPSYSGADGSRVFEALAQVELPLLLHAPGPVSAEFAPLYRLRPPGRRALAVHVPCPGHKKDLGVPFVEDNGPCFVAGATLADIEREARQSARLILQHTFRRDRRSGIDRRRLCDLAGSGSQTSAPNRAVSVAPDERSSHLSIRLSIRHAV